jgi:hypothetical protein
MHENDLYRCGERDQLRDGGIHTGFARLEARINNKPGQASIHNGRGFTRFLIRSWIGPSISELREKDFAISGQGWKYHFMGKFIERATCGTKNIVAIGLHRSIDTSPLAYKQGMIPVHRCPE